MKNISIILFIFLTSCSSSEIKFNPEMEALKNAIIGTFYKQIVVLKFDGSGEVVSLSSNNFRAKITPEDSGLEIEPDFSKCEYIDSERCNNYNKVVIRGVPKIKGVITIEIVAKTYSSMYYRSQAFVKKYHVTVY